MLEDYYRLRGLLSVKHMLEDYYRLKHMLDVGGLLSVKTLEDYYR